LLLLQQDGSAEVAALAAAAGRDASDAAAADPAALAAKVSAAAAAANRWEDSSFSPGPPLQQQPASHWHQLQPPHVMQPPHVIAIKSQTKRVTCNQTAEVSVVVIVRFSSNSSSHISNNLLEKGCLQRFAG
jgi:hypothetical protein